MVRPLVVLNTLRIMTLWFPQWFGRTELLQMKIEGMPSCITVTTTFGSDPL